MLTFNRNNIIERTMEDQILYDIKIFKKETKEADHCDHRFFIDYLIKNYDVDAKHQIDFKIYITKKLNKAGLVL
tara:strand:+ start:697 stop:918 length:222 start_codon:yes stop_codon:yes gene_type:complete